MIAIMKFLFKMWCKSIFVNKISYINGWLGDWEQILEKEEKHYMALITMIVFHHVLLQWESCKLLLVHDLKIFCDYIAIFILCLLLCSGYAIRKVTPQEPCEFGWVLCREKPTYAYLRIYEQRKFGFTFVQ